MVCFILFAHDVFAGPGFAPSGLGPVGSYFLASGNFWIFASPTRFVLVGLFWLGFGLFTACFTYVLLKLFCGEFDPGSG